AAHTPDPDKITSIELAVHPLVLELTGKTAPRTGLESKFSVFHAAAVAIVRGGGGEAEFSDAAATDPRIVALRGRVHATIDPALATDAARVTLVLAGGARLTEKIDHAVGSLLRPMSDAGLAAKLTALAAGVLPAPRTEKLVDLCWRIETLSDVAAIAAAARPT
ncbi:MAG TPA: MmgE/PrpD family protein, partial [Acetobacteraceae bacterium]|nr:MmgE/PrpD family protein [Acetobacteraceae bacterium]